MKAEGKWNFWERMNNIDKIIALALAVMALTALGLSLLQRAGLWLVHGAVTVYLPLCMIFILLGWGAYALHRRIRKFRMLAGIAMVVVLFLLITVVFGYFSFMTAITVPQKYAYAKSPSGARKIVILRGVDMNDDRVKERLAARLAADPDSEPDVSGDELGYYYAAYPRKGGMFYTPDANVEGEVAIGVESGGSLMIEWLEDETVVHLFVQNPGPGDGGDWYLRFE